VWEVAALSWERPLYPAEGTHIFGQGLRQQVRGLYPCCGKMVVHSPLRAKLTPCTLLCSKEWLLRYGEGGARAR